MIAFAIEMVFYIILDADMFNWYIAANTIVMMYMWMSPKYQWVSSSLCRRAALPFSQTHAAVALMRFRQLAHCLPR